MKILFTAAIAFHTVGILLLSGPVMGQGKWKTAQGANRPMVRSENAFVRVGTKYYLLGGRGIKPVEIFDPANNTWSEGAPTPLEISHCQAVAFQGLIYMMGGLVGNWPSETPLTHIFIYNPLMDVWIVGPEIPAHRQRGAAGTVVYNDKFYLVCGIVNGHTSGWVPWLDEFDPATNQWTELPDAPHARDHLQAAVVDDQLVVAGGRRSGYMGQGLEATVASTDIYNFKTGIWRTLPSPAGDIPTQRAGCTAVPIGNEVWLIGGESGAQVQAHSEMEALNVQTGNWRRLPSLNRGRHGTQVLHSDNQLVIAAGCGNRGGSPELDSFEVYVLPDQRGYTDTPVSGGNLILSESSLDFGNTPPYSTPSKRIELQNSDGNQGIAITYMTVAPTTEFEVDFPYSLPYILAPGKNVTFKVRFSPTRASHQEGTLFIKTMDNGKIQPLELELYGN